MKQTLFPTASGDPEPLGGIKSKPSTQQKGKDGVSTVGLEGWAARSGSVSAAAFWLP